MKLVKGDADWRRRPGGHRIVIEINDGVSPDLRPRCRRPSGLLLTPLTPSGACLIRLGSSVATDPVTCLERGPRPHIEEALHDQHEPNVPRYRIPARRGWKLSAPNRIERLRSMPSAGLPTFPMCPLWSWSLAHNAYLAARSRCFV